VSPDPGNNGEHQGFNKGGKERIERHSREKTNRLRKRYSKELGKKAGNVMVLTQRLGGKKEDLGTVSTAPALLTCRKVVGKSSQERGKGSILGKKKKRHFQGQEPRVEIGRGDQRKFGGGFPKGQNLKKRRKRKI